MIAAEQGLHFMTRRLLKSQARVDMQDEVSKTIVMTVCFSGVLRFHEHRMEALR